MGKNNNLFAAINILLMAVFLSTIALVFQLDGYYFIFEFVLLALLLAASAICVAGLYSGYRWVFSSLTLAMAIAMLNTIILYTLQPKVTPAYIISMVSTGIIFMLSAVKNKETSVIGQSVPETVHQIEIVHDIPHSSDADPVSYTSSSNIEETFDPGKYVASITGSVYHSPRCEWAKKIKKKKQVWFSDKSEAREKGYKAHECV